WKLALVIQKIASPVLLNSYESERRPVIQLNSEESLKNYTKILDVPKALGLDVRGLKIKARFVNHPIIQLLPQKWINNLIAYVQNALAKKALKVDQNPILRKRVQAVIQEQTDHFDRIGLDLGYVYRTGAIIPHSGDPIPEQPVSMYQPTIEPGVRFPHFWFPCQETQKSSHSWLQPDGFTLLCNSIGEVWWLKNKEYLPSAIQKSIRVINVERLFSLSGDPLPFPSYYPIRQTPILFIRPDGQIAWQPKELDLDICKIFEQLIPTSCVS
ncbi:MAG: hypothetical protein AAFV80_14405, partial [Bacteroidota bacterium]